MVLKGVQYLKHSPGNALKIQIRKGKQDGSNRSMITWDEFGCYLDVVSDVVQIAGDFYKFEILLCNRSRFVGAPLRPQTKERRGPHALNIAAE